jgi:hypothetical protein
MSQVTANQKPSTAIAELNAPLAVGLGDLLGGLPPLPEIFTHPTAYRVDWVNGEHWQYHCRTQWRETAMEIAKPLAAKGKIVRITEERYGEKIVCVFNAPDPKAT